MTQVELCSRLYLVLETVASEYDRRAQAYGCVITAEIYLIGLVVLEGWASRARM